MAHNVQRMIRAATALCCSYLASSQGERKPTMSSAAPTPASESDPDYTHHSGTHHSHNKHEHDTNGHHYHDHEHDGGDQHHQHGPDQSRPCAAPEPSRTPLGQRESPRLLQVKEARRAGIAMGLLFTTRPGWNGHVQACWGRGWHSRDGAPCYARGSGLPAACGLLAACLSPRRDQCHASIGALVGPTLTRQEGSPGR